MASRTERTPARRWSRQIVPIDGSGAADLRPGLR
jgi:hypothetical protein